jgi:hypothetical protein
VAAMADGGVWLLAVAEEELLVVVKWRRERWRRTCAGHDGRFGHGGGGDGGGRHEEWSGVESRTEGEGSEREKEVVVEAVMMAVVGPGHRGGNALRA